VRFVLIGVGGVNCYAPASQPIQLTQDQDLFLPANAANLVAAWQAAEASQLELITSGEPLDSPRDEWLARKIVERRALTRAIDGQGFVADFTLVMGEFDFDSVWNSRRTFEMGGSPLPVARLQHLVTSKAQAGRPKDLLFLETHKEALRELLGREGK
jgi:hypothetical protein